MPFCWFCCEVAQFFYCSLPLKWATISLGFVSNFLVNKARMLIVREVEVIRYWLFDLRSLGPLNPSVSCWTGCISHCSWAHLDEPLHDITNKMTCVPSKTQISLGIRPVWSVFADSMKKHWALNYRAHSEDSDQTAGSYAAFPPPQWCYT